MLDINGALKAIGYGLLVLFFAVGVVKTCSSLADLKRPEAAFKMFIRFVLAKAAVGYGLDLMLAVFKIIQGMVSTIITQSGLSGSSGTTLPQEIIDKINNVGFWDSIPLWAVTLLGGLFITVLAFIMILTVYSRLFKLLCARKGCGVSQSSSRAIWDSASSAAVGKGIPKGGKNCPITSRFIRRGNPMGSVAYRQRRKLGNYLTTTERQGETL